MLANRPRPGRPLRLLRQLLEQPWLLGQHSTVVQREFPQTKLYVSDGVLDNRELGGIRTA